MNRRRFNKLRKIFSIMLCLTLILCLSSLLGINRKGRAITLINRQDVAPVFQSSIKDGKIAYAGDNVPVSRALVAKMLAFIDNNKTEIDSIERSINFSDTPEDIWFDRYINAAMEHGYMTGAGDQFLPDKALTLEQAQVLINKIDKDNKTKIQIDNNNKDRAISYALWTELYYRMLQAVAEKEGLTVEDKFGIKMREVVILATPDNNSQLKDWNMITTTGPLSYKGLSMKEYIDKKISILEKDGEVIAILGVKDYTPTIEHAYIVNKEPDSITIFIGGAERTYSYNTTNLGEGKIADIKINGSIAENVKVYNNTLSVVAKRADYNTVELEDGILNLSENVGIYHISDDIAKWKNINAITIGDSPAEYIFNENSEVIAVIISDNSLPEKMRVALNTTGFGGLVHKSVSLTSDTDYEVQIGSETRNLKAGEVFNVSSNMFNDSVNRLYIKPNDGGKIKINNIKRNNQNPKYRGTIEIGMEEGGFSIVNELSMDEYLYSVVPSEMPTSHGLEAAKVQAVTARSYAYNQYYINRFFNFGANVDDSVNCQVYNNAQENETSIRAVDETSGMTLTYNGEVISANYFSTSAGITANAGEVWYDSETKEFPYETPEYLQSVKQYIGYDYGDLSIEDNAGKFFKDTTIDSYDSSFSWFRWNVHMTIQELSKSVNNGLKERYDANPELIKTLSHDGNFYSMPISKIGNIIDLEVTKRGVGGNIMEMKIQGTDNTILISTEYNIRQLLKPAKVGDERDIILNRKDGSTLSNYSLMPSGFFVFDKEYDTNGRLITVIFYGGGNGHGAGMSQNGVKGMIDAGYDFEYILKHYYKGIEIKKMI